MAKADNIFVRAKAYRKKHPRTSFQDAIQKVKGKAKVSGVKKKKRVGVTTTKRKAVTTPKRKTVTKRTTTIGRVKPATRKTAPTTSTIDRAMKIQREINKLETKRKRTKGTEAKRLIQVFINEQHDKLNALIRKRSA